MNQVLFLCSRNICSSRVAAALFNDLAQRVARRRARDPLLSWKAVSRGVELDQSGQFALSENAISYMNQQGIGFNPFRLAQLVEPSDLLWADRIVALYETDHRPVIESQFAFCANRVEYWDVPDFHESNWGKALPKLEANISELMAVIRSTEKIASC